MSPRKLLAGAVAVLATFAAAPAAAQHAKFLVTTEWLEKNLNDPKVRVVEVSVNPGLFERGHIPGAANVNWHTDLVDTVNRDIAPPKQFQALLARSGINADTTTVLYGDNNNWFAAWGAWIFDIYGIDNVKILDGGRKKWEAEGRPLANSAKIQPAGTAQIKTPNAALRAHLQDVLAVARKEKQGVLVDIRSADEYNGKIFAPNGVPELAVRAKTCRARSTSPGASWWRMTAPSSRQRNSRPSTRRPAWTAASPSSRTAALANGPAIRGLR